MPSSERVRLADGAEVAGRFRILSMLAEGRFGVVYSAEMLSGGASVMLKIIGTEAQIGAEDLARIRQEAELLAVLRHPHIVKIVDFGVTDEGNDYLAFEQLHGRTLQQAVADGPHPGSFVGAVALQVLDALELVPADLVRVRVRTRDATRTPTVCLHARVADVAA